MNATTFTDKIIDAVSLADTMTDTANTLLLVAAGIAAAQAHGTISHEAATGAATLLSVARREIDGLPRDNKNELTFVRSILLFVAEALPAMALDGISASVADGLSTQLQRCALALLRAI